LLLLGVLVEEDTQLLADLSLLNDALFNKSWEFKITIKSFYFTC